MVSVQTSRLHLRLGCQLLGRSLRGSASPFPSSLPNPSSLRPLVPGSPLHPHPPLHRPGAPVSLLSHQLEFYFPCSFLNWYLCHARGRAHGGRSAPDGLTKTRASFALVCLPSPARTTGIAPCFHPSQPEWALYTLTLRQAAQPLCTHSHALYVQRCVFLNPLTYILLSHSHPNAEWL